MSRRPVRPGVRGRGGSRSFRSGLRRAARRPRRARGRRPVRGRPGGARVNPVLLKKARKALKDLKKEREELKKEVLEHTQTNLQEIEEFQAHLSEDIATVLKNLPVSESERDVIWKIIENLESVRTEQLTIRQEVEDLSKDLLSSLDDAAASIPQVGQSIYMVQAMDVERVEKKAKMDEMEGLKKKHELKGFLLKQGKMRKNWKRRYFHFKKNLTFSYYPGKNMKKCLDTIDCKPMFKVAADTDAQDDFSLRVKTKNRVWKFLMANEDIVAKWKKDLKIWYALNSKKGGGEKKSLNEILTQNLD